MVTIQAHSQECLRALSNIRLNGLPRAVVLGFSRTARIARNRVANEARQRFKLHTEFIPKSVRYIPDRNKSHQITAAARAFRNKHKSFRAAVFIRGHTSVKHKLDFMLLHIEGGTKESIQKSTLAIPGKDLRRYSFKNRAGAARKAWKPASLLKHYNEVGPNTKGRKLGPRIKRRGKPKSFLMTARSGHQMIVRRKTRKNKKIEILYHLKKRAKIKKVWDFKEIVWTTVRNNLARNLNNQIERMKHATY